MKSKSCKEPMAKKIMKHEKEEGKEFKKMGKMHDKMTKKRKNKILFSKSYILLIIFRDFI